MTRMTCLIFVLLPSATPELRGRMTALLTASRSRSIPAAKEGMPGAGLLAAPVPAPEVAPESLHRLVHLPDFRVPHDHPRKLRGNDAVHFPDGLEEERHKVLETHVLCWRRSGVRAVDAAPAPRYSFRTSAPALLHEVHMIVEGLWETL